MVADAVAEGGEVAGFYAVLLWSAAFEEAPIGTIPTSSRLQSQMVGLGGAEKKWRRIAPDALRGFVPLVDPTGALIPERLGHPVTIEVAVGAWDRYEQHETQKAKRRAEQQRRRLRDECDKAGIPRDEVKGAVVADLWLAWLGANGLSISARHLRECREAVFSGWRPEQDGKIVPLYRSTDG